MKNTAYILMLSVLFMYSCSGPIYKPNDLHKNADYTHLLQINDKKDSDDYFVMNDSVSLFYFTEGVGEKILVIHGGPGYPFNQKWKGLDSLTKDFKFYYYHQRGCGKSTRPVEKFERQNFYKNMNYLNEHLGLPAQIADIEQIRRKIGQDKITIIGHSFGGFLACLYAIEFPAHVQSLLLVSPAEVVKMPSETGGLYKLVKHKLTGDNLSDYEKYMDMFFDYGALFSKTETQLATENLNFIKYYNLATGNVIDNDYSARKIGGWVQHACYLSMGKKHDYSSFLTQIKCPVLVIHGKDDIIPITSNNQYLNFMPQAKLEVIEKASHFSFNEQPLKFGEMVSDFLKE